jgi:quercetin dioxygenase-like cupin family protein
LPPRSQILADEFLRGFSSYSHEQRPIQLRGLSGPDHPGRVSFLGRRLPDAFEIRVVTVAPGATRMYQESEWRDSLVVVEHGRIQLEGTSGSRRDFVAGDVLCLLGLSLRALHNLESEPVVLVAVSRKGQAHPPTRATGRPAPVGESVRNTPCHIPNPDIEAIPD